MPNSKSAPHTAFVLLGMLSLFGLADCGLIVKPMDQTGAAGTTGAGGTTGLGGTGIAGGPAGVGGGVAGTGAGTTGTAGANPTGVAGVTGGGGAGTSGIAGTTGTAGTTGLAGTTGTAGGAAGTTGSGGGGAGGTAPSRGPTPAANGVNFPFPQNRQSSRCIYPTSYLNSDVLAAFNQWKTNNVTSNGAGGFLRVQRSKEPGLEPNSTVSEGIAYGMLIAVYMGDQTLFDNLWKYEQLHLNANRLMDWYISADGTRVLGAGAATDADEDMGWALVMADRQWGGRGTLAMDYIAYARAQISAVWNHEIWDSKLIRNGDGWGDWNNLNISYFAPSFYRVFKVIDTEHAAGWDAVILTSYDTIKAALKPANMNEANGLVPAWSTSTGDQVNPSPGANQPFHYQYDSCRTPFRIGIDWCLTGETRARDYVAKTSTFFSGIGADRIVDGYNLNGTPRHEHGPPAGSVLTPAQQSAAFLGPAAVGAMSSASYQTFVDAVYARLVQRQSVVGGTYYDESWLVLSLLMLTGNFLDYTTIQPVR